MTISTLIGNIDEQSLIGEVLIKDEQFLCFNTQFKDVDINIVISKYVWIPQYFGRVKLKGYITCIPAVSKTICFRVVDIEKVSEDTDLTNEVVISGVISKKHPYTVTVNGLEIITMLVNTTPQLLRGSVHVMVAAKDFMARYYRNIEEGCVLDCVHGYLKRRGKNYTIVLKKPQIKDNGGN